MVLTALNIGLQYCKAILNWEILLYIWFLSCFSRSWLPPFPFLPHLHTSFSCFLALHVGLALRNHPTLAALHYVAHKFCLPWTCSVHFLVWSSQKGRKYSFFFEGACIFFSLPLFSSFHISHWEKYPTVIASSHRLLLVSVSVAPHNFFSLQGWVEKLMYKFWFLCHWILVAVVHWSWLSELK